MNRTVGCTASHTFRLSSYSEEKIGSSVLANLECLERILRFNLEKGILFFRVSSDIVPFASHPVCTYDWRGRFSGNFLKLGKFIKKSGMRVSMHPDQFVLINALNEDIVRRSELELEYHSDVLDLMGLDSKAKVQIHIGGVYSDKEAAIERFVERYANLSPRVKKRLVIENDDRLYNLDDCLKISKRTGVPVLFDVFHHQCLSSGEKTEEALKKAAKTWRKKDGPLMVDYSEQEPEKRRGSHAETADIGKFKKFLAAALRTNADMDIMLEIKNKEQSAIKILSALKKTKK